jgi:hypothetical protein
MFLAASFSWAFNSYFWSCLFVSNLFFHWVAYYNKHVFFQVWLQPYNLWLLCCLLAGSKETSEHKIKLWELKDFHCGRSKVNCSWILSASNKVFESCYFLVQTWYSSFEDLLSSILIDWDKFLPFKIFFLIWLKNETTPQTNQTNKMDSNIYYSLSAFPPNLLCFFGGKGGSARDWTQGLMHAR